MEVWNNQAGESSDYNQSVDIEDDGTISIGLLVDSDTGWVSTSFTPDEWHQIVDATRSVWEPVPSVPTTQMAGGPPVTTTANASIEIRHLGGWGFTMWPDPPDDPRTWMQKVED